MPTERSPDIDIAELVIRVVCVVNRHRNGVAKHGDRFLERDAVLGPIRLGFGLVPFELQGLSKGASAQNERSLTRDR
jgi:hypothetical protein